MKAYKTILRTILSLLLISIFAISITPAIVFHNLFAAHKDCDIQHHHKRSSEIATAGINCHFDTFVCNSSFVIFFTPLTIEPVNINSSFLLISHPDFYSQHHFYAELRGPPLNT